MNPFTQSDLVLSEECKERLILHNLPTSVKVFNWFDFPKIVYMCYKHYIKCKQIDNEDVSFIYRWKHACYIRNLDLNNHSPYYSIRCSACSGNDIYDHLLVFNKTKTQILMKLWHLFG